MITIFKTNSDNQDFQELVNLLDKNLRKRVGDDHSFYAQYNKIAAIKHAIVAYEHKTAIGCGAYKSFDGETVEIKPMYVREENRGKGVGVDILEELEKWAFE